MATLKTMTTYRLMVLLFVFLFGNSFHLIPTDPASAGWTDDLYLPVTLLSGSLLLTTVAAATILLYVRMGKADKASPGWNKVHALLLLAVGLSAASTLLAAFTFEFGYRYRIGRPSVVFVLQAWVSMLFIMGLEHGICAGLLLFMHVYVCVCP